MDGTSWLEALRSAALDWRPPMSPLEWEAVKAHTAELPPDLRALYELSNGLRLPAGLRLFPLRGGAGEVSTLRLSQEPVAGLGTAGVWRFGRMGERVHLFAVRKGKILGRADGTPLPAWLQGLPAETWVYGIRHESGRQTRLFHSLAAVLAALLPDRLREVRAAEAAAAPSSGSIEIDLGADDSVEVELEVPADEATTEDVPAQELPPSQLPVEELDLDAVVEVVEPERPPPPPAAARKTRKPAKRKKPTRKKSTGRKPARKKRPRTPKR